MRKSTKDKKFTKWALTRAQSDKCESVARQLGGDYWKTWILIRRTGLHPIVIFPWSYKDGKLKEFNLRVIEDGSGNMVLAWNRPKKTGPEAHTVMPKHEDINFGIGGWLKEIRGRKSKYKKSPRWAADIMTRIGEEAGLEELNISPLTLRHSLCVDLVNAGVHSSIIKDTINVSARTLRTYAKQRPVERNRIVLNALNGIYSRSPTNAPIEGRVSTDQEPGPREKNALTPHESTPHETPEHEPEDMESIAQRLDFDEEPEPSEPHKSATEPEPENVVLPKDEPDMNPNPLISPAPETEICPVCSTEYEAGNQCPVCYDADSDRSGMPIKCPECGTEYPPDMKGCPVCHDAED